MLVLVEEFSSLLVLRLLAQVESCLYRAALLAQVRLVSPVAPCLCFLEVVPMVELEGSPYPVPTLLGLAQVPAVLS